MTRVMLLPLTIVGMAEANPEVNRLRREIRDRLGVDTIEVRQSLHTALEIRRRLSDNGIVAMLMDRHLGRDRVQVTLLGRPAWFLRTPALMGYLSGAPLMPCFIHRTESDPAFSIFLGDPSWSRPIGRATKPFSRPRSVCRSAERTDPAASRCWYQFYRYWDAQQVLTRASSSRLDQTIGPYLPRGLRADGRDGARGRVAAGPASSPAFSVRSHRMRTACWRRSGGTYTPCPPGRHALTRRKSLVAAIVALAVRAFARDSPMSGLVAAAWLGCLSHIALDVLSGARIRSGGRGSRTRQPAARRHGRSVASGDFRGRRDRAGDVAASRSSYALAVVAVVAAFLGLKAALLTLALVPDSSRPPIVEHDPVLTRIVEARWASLTEWYMFDRRAKTLTEWQIEAGRPPILLLSWPVVPESPLVRNSRSLRTVRKLLDVHEIGFAGEVPDEDGGSKVLWSDLRFCWRP
jgi:hypothetical protein